MVFKLIVSYDVYVNHSMKINALSYISLIFFFAANLVGCGHNDLTETNKINSDFSIYDGNYRGTFTYEYEVVTRDADKDLPGNECYSPWTSATIGITLTLEAQSFSMQTGWVKLKATDIICDDPIFGMGKNQPSIENSDLNSYALFPIPPDRILGPLEGIQLAINFPNGDYLFSNQIFANRGIFSASPGGTTISYVYIFTGSETYGAGAFSGYTSVGPFSPPKDYPDYFVRTNSWTLEKISG